MDVLGLMNVKNAIKIIVRVKRFDPNTVASRRKISSFQLFKEYLPQRLSEMALQAYKLSMTLTSSSGCMPCELPNDMQQGKEPTDPGCRIPVSAPRLCRRSRTKAQDGA
jgi:hypothetical protein